MDIGDRHAVALSTSSPIWSRFFTVAPLVIVGTREPDGGHDLAPKHMAMPLGWSNYFCFACSPRHATQHNAQATGHFTVSFPNADQIVQASLAAAPRDAAGDKPALDALPVLPARNVDGVLLRDAYLWLECALERIVEGFGDNTLIIGEVIAASVDERAVRDSERDDAELLEEAPLLAYLDPGRFARITESFSFPFPANFKI